MTESKQVTEIKRKARDIPTRDEQLQSKDTSFLYGGLQKWSKAERTRCRSISLAFTKPLTSVSTYYTKMDHILLELFFSPKWCVLNEGWRLPFIGLPRWFFLGCLHFKEVGRRRSFHAKDGILAIWHPLLCGHPSLLDEVGGKGSAQDEAVRGRPA